MARRPGRSFAPRLIQPILLAGVVLVSCSNTQGAPSASTISTQATVPTTSMPASTTTTAIPSTTQGSADEPSDLDAEVMVPEGEGPFPAVVLVHGGGWVAGSPALMRGLADHLTGNGYLTVNTSYTLSNGKVGFPVAIDDIACAVRHAATHPKSDGTVAIIGHSAGAHLAALVALDDGVYGQGCTIEQPMIPDRLIGLAGPYDVARLGPMLLPFFGAGRLDEPEAWATGNPMLQTDNNPDLTSFLLHGEEDVLVDLSFATDFAEALTESGSEAAVEIVPGARHNDMPQREVVGELIVDWLESGDG